ncbi:MAG: gfo/Idh/MocA family oxidoreductase, partial [Candidatus Poribacteria bacterium]|nr:gfo/Idh/MocA family oxidoreductase [Candidatus Poribacteria bacterium]
AELSDDEIAVADLLLRMAAYVRGGPLPYPLAEACQDRYLDILAAQAADTAQPVTSQPHPWSQALTT